MKGERDTLRCLDVERAGRELHALITRLYPFCRSLTGDGVRETLAVLRDHIPLEIREVDSGTQVFDWAVPQEWNIKDAYIQGPNGEKAIDFKNSNLHVVGYSSPVRERLSLEELKRHLFTLPDRPEWIPYRTSYYKESWGFCLSQRQLEKLEGGQYEVVIDSTLQDGHLTYGELLIKGRTEDEVLISTHICHPSLCNDNLSGIAVATFLAKNLMTAKARYSYRFLFLPATIGAITWLSLNESRVNRIKHGLVLACLGDAGRTTYKKSRRGDAEIDRAVTHLLKHSGEDFGVNEFVPYGYDERQFCSPGFNLPMGCLMRTPHGCFPEYHTSADNLSFVEPAALADSLSKCLTAMWILENNATFINQHPKCEPQLGRRGLYRPYGERKEQGNREQALLWTLNLSDGTHSLLDIAERAGLKFEAIREAANLLLGAQLLREKGS